VLLIFLMFYVVFFALFVFVLCLVYSMLPVSMHCPFVIAPSDCSNVYLIYYMCNTIYLYITITESTMY